MLVALYCGDAERVWAMLLGKGCLDWQWHKVNDLGVGSICCTAHHAGIVPYESPC